MNNQLQQETLKVLLEAFNFFDLDHRNKAEGELTDIVEEIEKSGQDIISQDDFLSYMYQKINSSDMEKDLLEAFKVFYRDGNGLINKDDLKIMLESVGEKFEDQDYKDMIKDVCGNEDGYINYNDFIKILKYK
ncbi:hypothetical protein IMG5_102150 [Ichthyophthirius multifiliis]|uniref:Calmodulin n=1 Tax=Ichthyophthirius multifiliis TaxID=5932 RepID=G0QSL7_ICHMU|nr:hypothetical protein IMG5_102150 [Ichthyophthirius multifiliis]EGR31776.1 hypothetical protein IMG5_102150 [Ichthyophthirius multifiliis]|eukprot:XP_004035262.1 hypothetical protein IMG5_102150 [Ichthyophthirius multifiliis]